jgi:hypothetical protein
MSPGAGHGLSHAQIKAMERPWIEAIIGLVHAIRGQPRQRCPGVNTQASL